MTPSTPPAMRASLESRLVDQSGDLGPGRLRRRLVYQRILRRLGEGPSADRWILKGGYLLEARLTAGARSTRDLDLTTAVATDLDAVRDALDTALAADPDGDFFRYEISGVTDLQVDRAGRTGWRFAVAVSLAGRTFDQVRLDVVPRAEEVLGATTLLELTCPVAGLPFGPARVQAVDVAQHAAEKFHALCRTYAGDRPSTRIKDLVDIVLMAEAGLLPDPRLGERLHVVFASRDGSPPAAELPDPPAAWERDYQKATGDLHPVAVHLSDAFVLASAIYRQAVTQARDEPRGAEQ